MSHLLLVSLFVKNGVSLETRQTKGLEVPGATVGQALLPSKRMVPCRPINSIEQGRPRPARAAALSTAAAQAI